MHSATGLEHKEGSCRFERRGGLQESEIAEFGVICEFPSEQYYSWQLDFEHRSRDAIARCRLAICASICWPAIPSTNMICILVCAVNPNSNPQAPACFADNAGHTLDTTLTAASFATQRLWHVHCNISKRFCRLQLSAKHIFGGARAATGRVCEPAWAAKADRHSGKRICRRRLQSLARYLT